MDTNRRVKFGTPIHSASSLCNSCRNATKVAGLAESQRFIICGELPNGKDLIQMTVVECSKYDDRSKPTLRHMEQIAWKLATDKKGKQIGFLSPRTYRNKLKAKELLTGDSSYIYDPVSDDDVFVGE